MKGEKMNRLPWNWTTDEAKEAYREYRDNGGDLPFNRWIDKHGLLDAVSNSASAPFANIRELSELLHV